MPNITTPFFPGKESKQIQWFGNLRLKIENAAYQAALEIDLTQYTRVQEICTLFIYILEVYLPALRQNAEAWTELITQLRKGTAPVSAPVAPVWAPPVGSADLDPGVLTELFDMIARWKTADGYTPSIGEDMEIVGETKAASTEPPELREKVDPDGVTLAFFKHGHMGIYIEGRRQGAEDWTFLAIDTESPYLDNRPNLTPGNSEWREYRARNWDGTPVGDWGPVVRANVG